MNNAKTGLASQCGDWLAAGRVLCHSRGQLMRLLRAETQPRVSELFVSKGSASWLLDLAKARDRMHSMLITITNMCQALLYVLCRCYVI